MIVGSRGGKTDFREKRQIWGLRSIGGLIALCKPLRHTHKKKHPFCRQVSIFFICLNGIEFKVGVHVTWRKSLNNSLKSDSFSNFREYRRTFSMDCRVNYRIASTTLSYGLSRGLRRLVESHCAHRSSYTDDHGRRLLSSRTIGTGRSAF